MTIPAVTPIGALDLAAPASGVSMARPPAPESFASMLTDGIASVQSNIASADHLARSFALDDSIPVHQVSFALEQAKLSMELMLQVRSRLVEGYQQLMSMQM